MALAATPSGYQTATYTARRNYTLGKAPDVSVENGITVAVKASPSWDKLAKRYGRFNGAEAIKRTGLINWAMAEGVKVAQSQLDILVYKAPLPKSAANDPNYLQRARTGRTREAIEQRPGADGKGAIAVSKAKYPAFYYATVLEQGSTKMNYAARHYWANTAAIMRPKFAAKAREALRQIKMDLKVR